MPATDETEVNENEVSENEIEVNGNTSDDAVQEMLDMYDLGDVSDPDPAAPEAAASNVLASDDPEQSRKIAWLLIGGGVVLTIFLILRGPRKLIAWLVPMGLIVAGLAILSQQRQAKLNAVAARVLTEMDGLGPVAKVQVLLAVGREQFPG